MMDFKVSKDTLADGLIERTSSMLGEIESKMCITTKKVTNRGKKTLNEVKVVQNICKNPQVSV